MKRLIFVLVLCIAGCTKAPTPTKTGVELNAGGGSAEVQEVTLKDGTRCAVLIGYYKGGIDCDWNTPVKVE